MKLPISPWTCAYVRCLTCTAQAQLPDNDAPAAAPTGVSDGPCCQNRAISVPIATYIVDIGLPLVLLLISYLVIRCAFTSAMHCHSSHVCFGLELRA